MASTEYLLPVLPIGSAEYTIVRWLKRVGDAVSAGEPLLVVVNDRLELALPATCAGVLDRIYAAEGGAVAPGVRLASIVEQTAAVCDVPYVVGSPAGDLEHTSHAAAGGRPPFGVRISPVARRIAKTIDVDITKLRGTGVSGRIMKADLLTALTEQPPIRRSAPQAPLPITHLPSPISHPSSPDVYVLTAIEVDFERVAALIDQHGPVFARRRLELSYSVCVAMAVVAALPAHPLLNSYCADSTIVIHRRVHLAVVAANSASASVVCDAQDLNLRGLARGLGQAGTQEQIADRTFTIVDLGDLAWGDLAAWASGAAVLGIGAVRARPLVIDQASEQLAIRRAALLTLAYDARMLDQCQADAFLRDIKIRLEQFHI